MAETSTGSQGSADVLEVTVKTLQKGAFPVKVSRDTTVTQLKEKLQPLSEIPAARQRLIFKGRVLRDEQTLQEVGIETGNAVHLVERPADAPPAGPPDPAGTRGPVPPMPGLNANPANMQDFSRFLGGVLSQLAGGGAAPVPGAPPAARGQPPPAQESMHLLVALHTFLQTLEGAAQVPPPIPITSLHPRFQDGATQQYRWLTTALQSVLNPAVLRPDQQAVLQQAVQELEATAPPPQPAAAARPAGDATTGTSAPAAPSGQPPPPAAAPPLGAGGPIPMHGVPFPPEGARGNLRRSPAPPYPYVQLIIPAIIGLVQRTHDYLNGPLARNLEGDISFLRDVRSLEGNRAEVAGRIRELTGRLHAAAALFTELARACAAACLATEGNAAALAFNTAAVLTADGTQPSFPRLLPRSDAPHIADTFIVRGDMDPTQLPAGMPPFPPGMFMMPNMASPGGTPGPTPTPADGSGAQTPAGAGPAAGMPDLGQAGVAGGTARFGPFVTPGGAAFGGFSIQGEGPMDIGQQLMSMFSNIPGAQVVQGPTTTTIAVTSTQFPGEDDLPPPPAPATGAPAPNASTDPFTPPLDGMPDLSNLPDIPFPDMGAIRIDMADVSLPQLLQQFQGMMGGNFMQQQTPVPGQAQQQPSQATPQSQQQQQPQQAGQSQQQRSMPMPPWTTPWTTPYAVVHPEAGRPHTHPPRATPASGPPDVAAILQTLSPVIQNLVQNVVTNVVQASTAPAATAPTPTPATSVPGSTTENAPGLQDQAGIRSAVSDAISTGLETVLGTLVRNLRSNTNLFVVDGSRGEYIHLMDMVQQLLSALVADYQPAGATTSSPVASTPAPAPSAMPASSAATATTTSSTPAAPNQPDSSQPSNSVSASREATVPGGDSAPSTSAPASSAPSMPPRGLGGTLKATSAKRKAVSAAAKSAAAASKADGHAAGPGPESTEAPTSSPADWSQLLQAAEVMRSTGVPSSVPAASPAVPPTALPSAALTVPTSQGSPPDSLAAMLGGMGGLGGLASQLTQGGAGGGGGGGLGNLFQMAGRIAADPTMRPMIEQAASELFGGGSSGGGGLGNLLGSLLGGGGAGARPAVQSRSATLSAPSWDALSSLGSPAAEEWRTIIEHDETEQLLMSEQTEFSDAYLAGAPPRGRSLFKKSDAPQN